MKKVGLKEELYLGFYGHFDPIKEVVKDSIPLETSIVLHLHYRYGITFREIAEIIGKSISIVYNHHNRGLYLLEKHSKQQELQKT